jgi:hypothetical protein
MNGYEIVVFVENKRRTSQTVDRYDVAESFARDVYRHMVMNRSYYEAVFDRSRHFISFANPIISVMMLGVVSEELFDKTKQEVWKLLCDEFPHF